MQDILKPERRYIIPTFKRDYEWTRDDQWRLLFEDLESTTERSLEARHSGAKGSALKSQEQTVSPHFLGAIVCARHRGFARDGLALPSATRSPPTRTAVGLDGCGCSLRLLCGARRRCWRAWVRLG